MLPTKTITLNVDVEKVKSMGIIPEGMDSLVVPQMQLRVIGNGLEKKDLAMLDLLASTNWERPLYVNNTSLAQFKVDLRPYVVQEGNAYRILPVQNPNPRDELVNTSVSFENMTKKFGFRGLDNPNAYFSEEYIKFVMNHRSSFLSLARALVNEGKPDKAREALLFSLEKMPDAGVRFDNFTSIQMVDLLMEVGEKERAIEITNLMTSRADEMIAYLLRENLLNSDLRLNMAVLSEFQRIMLEYGETDLAEQIEATYEKYRNTIPMPVNPGDM